MRNSIEEFYRQKEYYNKINNSFSKRLCYHVGYDAGLHSEVDAMMQMMLFCYKHEIKFILYADDANFSSGHGWEEFFLPFCEMAHEKENMYANKRHPRKIKIIIKHPFMVLKEYIGERKLRKKYDYLTQDLFDYAIKLKNKVSTTEIIEWPEFNVKGVTFDQFGKLANLALHYNEKTTKEIEARIEELNLPSNYYSIQFRKGDKITEYKEEELNTVGQAVKNIEKNNFDVKDIFVMADDYRQIYELKRLKPEWNIYTLTREDERGYKNREFNSKPWEFKRKEMIKLFSMIEICMNSDMHFGNKQSCVDNYIHSIREDKGYFSIWE